MHIFNFDFSDNKLTDRNRTVLLNCKNHYKQHTRQERRRVQKQHGGFEVNRK